VKGSRFITHMKKLKDPESSVKLFLSHSSRLREKRGPILFQLPPQMPANPPRLVEFIQAFRRHRRLRIALEFRHQSWFNDEIYEMVDKAGWTVCLADWQNLPRDVPVLGSFCYIRRHGATARYAGSYSDEQLQSDAEFAQKVARLKRDVYIYFNNDVHAHAIKNAFTLTKLIDPTYLHHSAGKLS
jgi:uncharacterized protein YecE (DUF72 family)